MSFRSSIRRISPTFLQNVVGEKLMYGYGLVLDALADALQQGVKARMPGIGTPDALPAIGRDRRILRGFAETDVSYALRLRRWLDDWRTAGNPFALMEQVKEYLTPHAVRLRTVDDSGNWYTLNADGTTEVVHTKPANNWNWDGVTSQWSRFWLILYPPPGLWTEGPDWGGAGAPWGAPGTTWGSTATPEQVSSIRTIVAQWKPAHAKCMNIIVAFDPASFDPAVAPGPPLPDGNWGSWSKGGAGHRVAARLASARYWDGP